MSEVDELRLERRNLLLLVAALVYEAGGEVVVPDSTLVNVVGEVYVENRLGGVVVRAS